MKVCGLEQFDPCNDRGLWHGSTCQRRASTDPLPLPTTKHVHMVVRTLSRRQTRRGKISVGVSSEEAVSTDPDVSGKETHGVKSAKTSE